MSEANIWQPRTVLEISADTKSVEEKLTAIKEQTLFNLTSFVYVVGTGALSVHKNGLLLTKGTDWVEQTSTTFAVITPCTVGDVVVATGATAIVGDVDVRDTDIFLSNVQSLRDYAGTEITIYVQGESTQGDGREAMYSKITGQAAGYFVDAGVNVIVPTGGDGSIGWITKEAKFWTNIDKPSVARTCDLVSGNCFDIIAKDDGVVEGFEVARINKDPTLTGQGITAKNSERFTIQDMVFTGVDGQGFGCFIYNSLGGTNKDNSIINTIHSGTTTDATQSNGGAMLVDTYFGLISNTRTHGIKRFPVELKADCQYCVVENSYVEDGNYGVYYGTQSAIHPSNNIVNNVITKATAVSVLAEAGSHNIFSNILCDATGFDSVLNQAHGVRLDSADSLATNILTRSDGSYFLYPVRYRAQARRNHASVMPRHDSIHSVTYDAGAERNSTEILGTKGTDSIFTPNVVTFAATNHSGPTGNPVYSHPNGEYWGTISGKWRWVYEGLVAGASVFSSDKWQMENSEGTARLAFVGPEGAGNELGIVAATPIQRASFVFSPALQGWVQEVPSGQSYRAIQSAYYPALTATSKLGQAGNLWSEVFASTAAINTSDERAKTPLEDISDIERLVALEIKTGLRKFKIKSAVDKKGEGTARVHFGVGAQTVGEVFKKHGLDPHDYSLFCYDEWDAEEEVLNEDGNILIHGRESGSSYGIRYEELLCFIIAAM